MPKARDIIKSIFVGDGLVGSVVRVSVSMAGGYLVSKGVADPQHVEAVAANAGLLADSVAALLSGSLLGLGGLVLSRLNKKF